MKLLLAFSLYLCISIAEAFLNRQMPIQPRSSLIMPRTRLSRARRYMSQMPIRPSSRMPRLRDIPQAPTTGPASRIPRLNGGFGGPMNMAPQINPYYWSQGMYKNRVKNGIISVGTNLRIPNLEPTEPPVCS